MADNLNPNPTPGAVDGASGSAEPLANPAMVVRRRASVNLRDGQTDSAASLMDPANQSLADALKITYRVLQVGMLGLVGMFAFSGLQSVQTGERGIRVVMGAVQSTDLTPGFQFSLPRPLGEIVKINTGVENLPLKNQFFPMLSAGSENRSISDIAASARGLLDPAQDGSMLSADLSLAHARFTVQYQRKNVQENARNIAPEFERNMVEAAAMRGVVHAAARLTVDEIIRNQPDAARKGDFPSLDIEARRLAQEALDAMGTGIEIVQFNVEERYPPLVLLSAFAGVQTAQAAANKDIQKAQTDRTQTLAAVAGEASTVLLELIDQYEEVVGQDPAKAEAALAEIDAAMDAKPVTVKGAKVTPRVTGKVAATLSESQQYRSSVVSRAQADARVFEAKLGAFRANPSVVLTGDWTEALQTFLDRDTMQVFMLPPGKMIDIWLNRDPDISKQQETMRLRADAERVEKERVKKLDEQKFNNFNTTGTTTGQ